MNLDKLDLNKVEYKKLFLILAVAYLAIRLTLISYVPFMQDEGLYAVMIEEQIAHPTLVTTYLGYEVGWKPPLFFWISGFFVQFLRDLPIPIEAVYRLPTILFGLINVFLVFFIFEKTTKRKDLAFLIALAYVTVGVCIHTELRVLTDTICGTFIYAGILAYLNISKGNHWLLLGAIFTFLAYFTKQYTAAIVPFFAVAYVFQNDRKKLFAPLFVISLLAFPLAALAEDATRGWGLGNTTAIVTNNTLIKNLNWAHIGGSLIAIFAYTAAFFIFSLFGFWKNWKEDYAMSVWYLLMVFPFIAGALMTFYFYPVIPVMVYFTITVLSRDGKKIKLDKFFYLVYFMVLILGLCLSIATHISYRELLLLQKDVGDFLAGKENVMIIGAYGPGIQSYKVLDEIRTNGSALDYGLIISDNNETTESYQRFVDNYMVERDDVIDGNFKWAFMITDKIYRKSTNVTDFDYICLVGNVSQNVTVDGELVLENQYISVYKKGG